ncbi:MAG: 4Fe-4S dicluster domain-containing protein [Candidatus Omnitrophota bacterium]
MSKVSKKEKRIYCDISKCLGCKSCQIACALVNSQSKEIYSAVKEKPLPKKRVFIQVSCDGIYPLQCRHCDEPLCVLSCMSAAITKDSVNNVVVIDEEKCVACGMCIMSCPFGALIIDSDKKVAVKCDLCIGKNADERNDPVCVQSCPTKSLFFGSREEFLRKKEGGK